MTRHDSTNTNLCSSLMAEAEVDNILSFWRFEYSSTMNSVSSENIGSTIPCFSIASSLRLGQ